jgi:hypothetical protein
VILFVAAALGMAALLGLSLVLKLRSIRRRGFGEGARLDLPEAGLEMRYPHWWKPVREAPPAGTAASEPAGAGPSAHTERPVVVLKTGHSRGLLRIISWREDGPGDEAPLKAALGSYLQRGGLELDDPEITTAPFRRKPSDDGASLEAGPSGLRVWVASGGRQASRPEERTYFEVHLLAQGRARVLFSYTNSILQGFLDAYYLEKVLETLQPGPFPR